MTVFDFSVQLKVLSLQKICISFEERENGKLDLVRGLVMREKEVARCQRREMRGCLLL